MSICDSVRDRIPEMLAGSLSAGEIAELNAHINRCRACSDYLQALQADDRKLCEFTKAMQPAIGRIENNVISQLEHRPLFTRACLITIWRKIMESPRARIAVAAVMILAVLIGAGILIGSDGKDNNVKDRAEIAQSDLPVIDDANVQSIVDLEREKIWAMVAASDIDGLVSMLKSGQWDSKLSAANFLGKVGDFRAIEALETISEQWQGEEEENPFAKAVAQIKERLEQKEQSKPNAQQVEKASDDSVSAANVAGIVKDEQGTPVPDATIVLYHNVSKWGLGNSVVEQVVSSANGSFVLSKPLAYNSISDHSYAQDEYILLATHPNYALGWKNITQMSDWGRFEIVMTEPTSRTITVTGHDEKPLEGVRVWLYSAGDRKSSNPVFRNYFSLATDVGLTGGTTGTDGKVTVTNMPKIDCSFHATLKGYATGLAFSNRDYIRLSKGATVSGTVLDEEGKPVEGAIVRFHTNWGMWQFFLVKTDSHGRFCLKDLPAKGWDMSPWGEEENADGSYKITVEHDDYICPETQDQFEPGEVVENFNLDAYRGTVVECHVIEPGTNQPLSGARIQGSNECGRIAGYSDENGIFTVRVMSGHTSLYCISPPDGVYVAENQCGPTVNFNAQGQQMTVTIQSAPIAGLLVSVPGIVYWPDGSILTETEAVVYAAAGSFHTSTAGSYVRPVGIDGDGKFELKEVPAGKTLKIYAETKDHTFATNGAFEIPAEPNDVISLELKLEPTQSASVIVQDETGRIAEGMTFDISPMVAGEWIWPAARRGSTDENGLLEIDGVLPGLEYHLRDEKFDRLGGRLPAGMDKWFIHKMILIPIEP